MTPMRLRLLAAILAGAALTAAAAGPEQPHAWLSASAPESGRGGPAVVVAVPAGPAPASRPPGPAGKPSVSPSGSPSQDGTRARPPDAHLQPFAGDLGGPLRTPGPPLAGVTIPAGVDGCDHAYGVANQCVPWSFPPGTANLCGWLAAHGLADLPVHGSDRHALDTNRDGIACGPGDG